MAKGILKTPRRPRTVPKGILKHEDVMKKTTPAQRANWAHNYVKGFTAAQMLKRRGGL